MNKKISKNVSESLGLRLLPSVASLHVFERAQTCCEVTNGSQLRWRVIHPLKIKKRDNRRNISSLNEIKRKYVLSSRLSLFNFLFRRNITSNFFKKFNFHPLD